MKLEESYIEQYRFHGIAKKIRIVSNNLCYGSAPEVGDVIEQHLTINNQGKVWLSHYGYDKEVFRKKLRGEQFSISVEQANFILAAVGLAFSRTSISILERDVGEWKLEITDSNGNMKEFMDSLVPESDPEKLSRIIRKELGRMDLILFDGQAKL